MMLLIGSGYLHSANACFDLSSSYSPRAAISVSEHYWTNRRSVACIQPRNMQTKAVYLLLCQTGFESYEATVSPAGLNPVCYHLRLVSGSNPKQAFSLSRSTLDGTLSNSLTSRVNNPLHGAPCGQCPRTSTASLIWLRRWELHPQSLGYEPSELLFLYPAIIWAGVRELPLSIRTA